MDRAEFTGSSSRAGGLITQAHPNNPQSKQTIGSLIIIQNNKAYQIDQATKSVMDMQNLTQL